MSEPEAANSVYCPTRADWRAWLEANHSVKDEVWLLVYKKASGKPSVSMRDAREECACFGWVDSVMKALDSDRYALRFTPRKPNSNWSKSNRRRVRDMIAQGLMTPAGLAKVAFPLDEGPPVE